MDGAEFCWAAPSDVMNNGELVSTALKNPTPATCYEAEQTKIWRKINKLQTNFALFSFVGATLVLTVRPLLPLTGYFTPPSTDRLTGGCFYFLVQL